GSHQPCYSEVAHMAQTATIPAYPPVDTPNPNKRIQASEVRDLCGGISDMTLWRWLDDAKLDFPRPIYIARRRYWREADVIAWLEAREVAA
ncbi:helix-turn-helix transcriptional regulator, partial [Cribrihabitans sp. XS_ASV171]